MTMTEVEFQVVLKRLEGLYRTKLSEEERKAYWTAWRRYSALVVLTAMDGWMQSDQAVYFPSAPAIAALADRAQHEQSLKRHQQDRATERHGWRQIEEQTTDDVGTASLALIHDREQRERVIAGYHAKGDARREPCGQFCRHGTRAAGAR